MGSIGSRLGRLEGANPCPECGGALTPEYEVVWEVGPLQDLVPERCKVCDEPLEIVVTWSDVDRDLGA